jgi:hypothetical protein
MPKLNNSHCVRFTAGSAVLLALLPAPALAQYIGNAPPPPLPAAPRAGEIETPAAALARALRTLAQSPRDFVALITGGRAALDLGDMQTAIGFFGRAEEVRPSDPAPKIGMGAATVASGDARGALAWFSQAQQLGATAVAMGADRGLAQDLLGNQSAAQLDYRAALGGRDADEARRRLALSLGISGDRGNAFSTLQPLLMRRDPAAQRIRAFVLALVGDERGASTAIDSAMPGSGARMAGFFRLLPNLSAPQKAAAVHLGVFPDPSEIRVAAVSPRIVTAPPATRRAPQVTRPSVATATSTPRPAFAPPRQVTVVDPDDRASVSAFKFRRREPRPAKKIAVVQTAPPPAPVVAAPVAALPQPSFSAAQATPIASMPVAPAAPLVSAVEAPIETAAAATPTIEPQAKELAPPVVAVTGDRLSGIDRLLAQADELPVPPAPRPRFEKAAKVTARDTAKASKVTEAKRLADAKKLAEAKAAAEEKEAREALGVAGSQWVQLAGGQNEDRMATEFKKLAAKSSALRKRGGLVTQGKDYFRLLTGPFASKSEAQSFVNQLAKDGVDGFSWTRTPTTIRIEKLSPK